MHSKRIVVACAVVIALFVMGVVALQSRRLGTYYFRPNKIAVGSVYHYIKTNLDGSHPERVSIYVSDRNTIESFKFHAPAERAGLVIATMDWSTFSARRLESWQVFAEGKKQLFATMEYHPSRQAVEVSIPSLEKSSEWTDVPLTPFHVYNFDLASLNFAFRHLNNPRGKFSFGVVDPTHQEQGPLMTYKGVVDVAYVGDEERQGKPCRKYAIDGPGLENRGGHIWVNKDGEYFEDVEIDLPDNPDWSSFKFRLIGAGQMSSEVWERFQRSQF